MSANSSSNDSLLHLNLDSIPHYFPYHMYYCLNTTPSSIIFISFYVTNIFLLLPLSILVLYLGLQRWQQQRSSISHSDSLTFHMVIMELVGVLGSFLCCSWIWRNVTVVLVGIYVSSITWYGGTVLHVLTCVEHYLAVVHPITYMSLRKERGIRIRNISIGCAWLLCFVATSLLLVKTVTLILDVFFMTFSLIVISFCNLSVLRVLIRPGVREHGSDRERVDQLKKRAFYTITAILGVLLLKCGYSLSWNIVYFARESRECVLFMSESWAIFPSKLVLPLLFLQRAGIFACYKNNTK